MKTINKLNQKKVISPAITTIVALSIFSGLYYLIFLFNSDNISDFLFYSVAVIVELYVIVTAIFTWWTIIFHDKGVEIVKEFKSSGKPFQGNVAVILAVYTEPLRIVEETLNACKNLTVPHTLYVGDDSGRYEVKALAEKYGAIYISREKNTYNKSGNINNVLSQVKEDFVVTFDIDHKPLPQFLEKTLPYFNDAEVAFVQTPQYYTNTSSTIAKGASGAQNIFYELIMPGKNAFNSAICVGTNVIYRKKALDEVLNGGIYLLDHSEDIYTGLTLHAAGWKSAYVPEVLAEGLAPTEIDSYFRQQLRWARGGFSILFNFNKLFSKKLTIEQKAQYVFSTLHYFSGFAILFYLLMPIVYLLTGIKPFAVADSTTWILHFMPFFLSKFLLILYLMEHFDPALLSTSLGLFPVYIKAFFIELLGKKDYSWEVTNSEELSNNEKRSVYDYLVSHVFIILLSLVAIFTGLITLQDKVTAFMFSFWAGVNVILLIHFIYAALEKKTEVKIYDF
ncbi:MAG: glycosyltransferase [Patescibacteria group bacterium]